MIQLNEPYFKYDFSLIHINSLEKLLIDCKEGSDSIIFTKMMTMTKMFNEWKKENDLNRFKSDLDKQVESIAYNVECGMRTDVSIKELGLDINGFYSRINETHRLILEVARKKRKHNRKF